MSKLELAEKIYKYVNSIQCQRHGASWDKWDDLREIEFIKSLIENNDTTSKLPGVNNNEVKPSNPQMVKEVW